MNVISYNDSCGSDVVINGKAFRMDKMITQSSNSRIFAAYPLQNGGDPAFVIKRIDCRRDSDTWKNAMREIEAAILLCKCSYTVHLLGYSVVSDAKREDYIVYLLFDRLKCLDDMEITDTPTVLTICRDICLALECIRKQGLVHGDVKPRNIYYDGKKWLLGDLGSVFVSGEVPESGSEGYFSPEAFRGETCDIRADIYSLGITAYKMLSGGRFPFCDVRCDKTDERDVYSAIKRRLSGEEIPPLRDVDMDVNRLLLKMCRFDRRDRFKKPCLIAKAAEKLLSELI